MKVRFYCDLWPGIDPTKTTLNAMTSPYSEKGPGVTRIAFDVVIPDRLIYRFDAVAPEVSSPVVVGE